MKFEFNLSLSEIVVNYVLMMAVIIIAGFSGQWWLAFVGLPLFLRGLLGWCPVKTMLKNSKSAAGKTVSLKSHEHRMAA